ncbi:MAG: phosphodiester glycosidase family protein [Oscillospiraceae bacterium]|nr:phosphodiester glycosidase family protein [Oscillospiraceae bacterium]
MKNRTKALFAAILALVLAFSVLPLGSLAAGTTAAVSSANTSAGKSAKFVTLDAGFVPKVVTAGGVITKDANAADLVAAAGDAAVVVDGTYFNSYYKATEKTFEGNTPVTFGTLYQDGEFWRAEGYTPTLGYTNSGKYVIGNVDRGGNKSIAEVYITRPTHRSGYPDEFEINVAVNSLNYDAVVLVNSKLGLTWTIESGAVGYTIENNAVTGVLTSGTFTATATKSLIYFPQSQKSTYDGWKMLPEVGDAARVNVIFAASDGSDAADWADIKMAVSAGPLLLWNGTDVSGDTTINSQFQESKDKGNAARTFLGVKADGTVIIGQASTSHADAAKTLAALGCTDAIALDGGASSFLYANGKTITDAGRKLNNVIAFYGTPAEPVPDEPSSWAVTEIKEADAAGLVPAGFVGNWQKVTSRLDAAAATVQLFEKATGKTAAEIAAEKGWVIEAQPFSDTTDRNVAFLKAAGITNGVGDNKYGITGSYTRIQEVVMLGRGAEAILGVTITGTHNFKDIPDWGDKYVGWAVTAKITNGVSETEFDSNGDLKNEHTVVFNKRALAAFK